MSLVKRKGSTG